MPLTFLFCFMWIKLACNSVCTKKIYFAKPFKKCLYIFPWKIGNMCQPKWKFKNRIQGKNVCRILMTLKVNICYDQLDP